MSTTYTNAELRWGNHGLAIVKPKGADYKNAIVTYPAEATPYFSVVLTKPDDTTELIDSNELTLITPARS